jgi:FMN phosphatase YigB (HAD superfamily)
MAATTAKALIFDLGDVIFNWKAPTDGRISPKVLKRVMSTRPWHKFECGQISERDCFERAGKILSLEPSDIADTMNKAKLSLTCDNGLLGMLKELKESSGKLKIYVMSNISKPHYDLIRSQPWDWSLFEHVFTSADVGMRKPDLNFYEHVLKAIGENCPENVLFVDDKLENIVSAKSLGFRAIQFDEVGTGRVMQQILNNVGDPIQRGNEFLLKNAKNMPSFTNNGLEIKENFAQLIMLEATGNW